MTAEDGERGDNSDARWKTSKRAAETGNALLPTVDRRVRRTSRDVDEAERIVVVWLQCLLVDVVSHTGTLAPDPDHVDICSPKPQPCR